MWHVMWLQGAMELCVTGLAQMKHTSASASVSSPPAGGGLACTSAAGAAGAAGASPPWALELPLPLPRCLPPPPPPPPRALESPRPRPRPPRPPRPPLLPSARGLWVPAPSLPPAAALPTEAIFCRPGGGLGGRGGVDTLVGPDRSLASRKGAFALLDAGSNADARLCL